MPPTKGSARSPLFACLAAAAAWYFTVAPKSQAVEVIEVRPTAAEANPAAIPPPAPASPPAEGAPGTTDTALLPGASPEGSSATPRAARSAATPVGSEERDVSPRAPKKSPADSPEELFLNPYKK